MRFELLLKKGILLARLLPKEKLAKLLLPGSSLIVKHILGGWFNCWKKGNVFYQGQIHQLASKVDRSGYLWEVTKIKMKNIMD